MAVYMHRIRPNIWYFPCLRYRIYIVHYQGWPELYMSVRMALAPLINCPANNTVYRPYLCMVRQPNLCLCIAYPATIETFASYLLEQTPQVNITAIYAYLWPCITTRVYPAIMKTLAGYLLEQTPQIYITAIYAYLWPCITTDTPGLHHGNLCVSVAMHYN